MRFVVTVDAVNAATASGATHHQPSGGNAAAKSAPPTTARSTLATTWTPGLVFIVLPSHRRFAIENGAN